MKTIPCAALAFLAMLSPHVGAATFVVTRFDDPLPATCTVASCSLREAVMSGNNDPFAAPDRIELAAGTYTLIRGALPQHHHLELVGAGSATTSIVTDAAVFQTQGADDLTLRGVAVQTTDFNVLSMIGDAVLTLDDVVVPDGGGSVVASGEASLDVSGGEFRDSMQCNVSEGTCTLRDTTLFNLYLNPSFDPGPTLVMQRVRIDGSLFPDAPLDSQVMVHQSPSIDIEDSTFVDTILRINDAVADIRGSTFEASPLRIATSSVDIDDSTITRSAVRVDNTGPQQVNFRRLLYIDNTGPITAEAPSRISIEDSEFSANPVRALYAANASIWTVRGSSFVDNVVDGNAGGAIVIEDNATMTIENSTFSGNTFTDAAAEAGATGAAIGYRNIVDARLDLRHVTLAKPGRVPTGTLGSVLGGRVSAGDMVVNIDNSIVAGSCALQPGDLHHATGNIEVPADTCGFNPLANQVDVSANTLGLGSLDDHGGPTPTYEPDADGAAEGSADDGRCLAVDQRGYPRPIGSGCDVGAVEIGSGFDLLIDGFESPGPDE